MIAGIAPNSLMPKVTYGAMPTMTTSDNQVFTFGTDTNNYPIFPIGKTGIYRNLADIPDYPMVEGCDFLDEGNQIRIPNNRTYTGTLYWRGIQQPADIDATHQPSLIPEASRELFVIDAVRQFANEYSRNPALAQAMESEFAQAWPRWLLAWKTQFKSGGALRSTGGMHLTMAGSLS